MYIIPQKIMKLCECPVDVCRADVPPENCRYVMDPHDKLREIKMTSKPTKDTNVSVETPESYANRFHPSDAKNIMCVRYELASTLERQRDQARRELEHKKELTEQAAYQIAQIARGAKLSSHVRKRLYEIAFMCAPTYVSVSEQRQYDIKPNVGETT